MTMNRLTALHEGVTIAMDALRANWVRSSLTILGVTIGVGVVVTMAALITGIRSSIVSGFESAGPDNFIVSRIDFSDLRIVNSNGRPPWWGKPVIQAVEADFLNELDAIDEALYNFGTVTTMSFEGRRVSGIQSSGYSAGWVSYQPGGFTAGRDFTPHEVRASRPLVVVSKPLADQLFEDRDPIGRKIRVGAGSRGVNEAFEVVGVFEPEANIFTAAIQNWAVFPYTSAMKRLKVSNWQAQILVVPVEGRQSDALDQVTASLRTRRGLRPGDDNDFSLIPSAAILDIFNQLTGVFFLVMIALSSVGLLVGGIGVIGIMLISVKERTREIGIRKAVGATRRDILWQFLVEATVLTLIGGGTGLMLGAAASTTVAAYTPVPSSIPLWSIFVSLLMAAITGILFGLFPAFRAANMDPVRALGHE